MAWAVKGSEFNRCLRARTGSNRDGDCSQPNLPNLCLITNSSTLTSLILRSLPGSVKRLLSRWLIRSLPAKNQIKAQVSSNNFIADSRFALKQRLYLGIRVVEIRRQIEEAFGQAKRALRPHCTSQGAQFGDGPIAVAK